MSKLLDVNDENIYTYRYGRYFSNGVLVMGVAALFFGCLLLLFHFNSNLLYCALGILLIAIGITSFIPTELFQVNFQSKEYRVCMKFFSHYKGEWKNLNRVQYLSIINRSSTMSSSAPGVLKSVGTIVENVTDCNLRFYIKAGYYVEIDDFDRLKKAIEIGSIIAKGLDLKLLNATERPPVFVDL